MAQALVGGLAGVNPSFASPLTRFTWESNINHLKGSVEFNSDNTLFVKPTTEVPSNSMRGTWQLDGSSTFKTSGLASTMMLPPQQSQEVEHVMKNLFNERERVPFQVVSESQDGQYASLLVGSKDGSMVKFFGRIKPEVQWGEPTLEFFELRGAQDADKVTTAFVIRPIDPNSGKPLSEWRPYRNQINDLKLPSPGEKLMVRVKKFTINNTFPQQPSQQWAYYADLVFGRGPTDE